MAQHAPAAETPIRRAKRLRTSPQAQALSETYREHLRRIDAKLSPEIVKVLDAEEAPFYVCRWISWGKRIHDRTLRLGLALFLRREADLRNPGRSTTGWAWARDRVAACAEKLFRQSPQFELLLKARVVLPAHQIPTPVETVAYLSNWSTHWQTLGNVLAMLDRAAFMQQITQACAAKPKRRRVSKRKPLTPKQIALLDALGTLRRAAIEGTFTLDDLPNLNQKASK